MKKVYLIKAIDIINIVKHFQNSTPAIHSWLLNAMLAWKLWTLKLFWNRYTWASNLWWFFSL